MPDLHIDVVAVFISVIALIGGYAELKFKSNENEKKLEAFRIEVRSALDAVWKKQDDISGELRKEISEMNKSLARIEGKLSVENKS